MPVTCPKMSKPTYLVADTPKEPSLVGRSRLILCILCSSTSPTPQISRFTYHVSIPTASPGRRDLCLEGSFLQTSNALHFRDPIRTRPGQTTPSSKFSCTSAIQYDKIPKTPARALAAICLKQKGSLFVHLCPMICRCLSSSGRIQRSISIWAARHGRIRKSLRSVSDFICRATTRTALECVR
jgi:hypothetical protein